MLSRFFPLRRSQAVSSSFLAEKLTYFRDASSLYNLVTQRGISTARTESSSGKLYADFAIFKGKAALLITPVSPKFIGMASGRQMVDRKGIVLFKFIPAIGAHKYDSERKQYFALSATEVGCLISLGPVESCEFFHDPSMKKSSEGQIKKTLSISPFPDGGGYIFNLSVMDSLNKTNERFTLPVTKAEFSVMRTAFGFVLPHIMGWDRLMEPQHGDTEHGQPHGIAARPSLLSRLMEPQHGNTEQGQPHGTAARPRLLSRLMEPQHGNTEQGQPHGTAARPHGLGRLRQSEKKMDPDSEWVR
ncbi:hypothetical protein KSP39_PZI006989 [Platanthera zijinensis]|uniref:Uncharacterized protein n=1 Tax=Platanthera zijinensis TaxID=2320716 RepID=A0AAP0BQJ0_9ASPA